MAYQNDELLKAQILTVVNGGLWVSVLDGMAFLPAEHISEISPRLFSRIKGQTIDVRIIKLVSQTHGVIVSHDLVLDAQKRKPQVHKNPGPATATAPSGLKLKICKRCGKTISRSYSICSVCRVPRHRQPPPPRLLQGGSPGLRKKLTMKVAKKKKE
jgi:hypothetical protein